MKTPILGGEYITRSTSAGANRCINLFAEEVGEGGKEPGFLSRCPGMTKKVAVGTGPIRGSIKAGSNAYVVSGSKLYKVTPAYSVTEEGTVATGSGIVSMAFNGTQIMIACNPEAYIYNTATDAFAQITDPDFPGASAVDHLDGYFVFSQPSTQKFWVTALLNGLAVDPLEFSSAEGSPDNLTTLRVSHREVWLFGTDSIEVFYNAGNTDFPLSRIQGAFIEAGCAAANSVAKLDNSLFWLGSDARGTGIIFRADGYTAKRISNHAIESTIQGFSTVVDAIAYSYQQDGHYFYVISFPTADRTFCYDVATGLWHERGDHSDGEFHQHRARCMFILNEQVHVGDRLNGFIYTFDLDNYTDNGKAQKWLRSWRALPTGKNTLKRLIHHQLQIDCEVGVGLNSGQGEEASVMLRWSDDGGKTFGNYHLGSFGRIGEFLYRPIWRRLGMSRDRVYELSGSDPNKIIIMGAELKTTETKS